METEEELRPLSTSGELAMNVLNKHEAERQHQDSHAPELVEREFIIDLEYLQSIKTEKDPSDAVAYTVQQITTDAEASADGYEYTIRVLTSEDEFMDDKEDSGSQQNNPQVLAPADDQQARVSKSDEKNGSYEFRANSKPKKRRTHSGGTYKCELCSRFLLKKNFSTHQKTHAKNRERKFPCQLCENAFYTRPQLMKHIRTHAKESVNCEFCGAPFLHQRSLTNHLFRLHADELSGTVPALGGKKESACYSPGSQESALGLVEAQQAKVGISVMQNEAHELSPTNPGNCERLYKCELCLRFFKNEKYLTNHQKLHLRNRKRKFACLQCERAFYTQRDLDTHVRVHSGVTYDCHLCGASFTQTGNLKAHMLRQHLGETQQLLSSLDPQTPRNASVNTKAEPCSDEEFLDDDAAHGSQESSLQPIVAEQNKVSLLDEEMESCKVCQKLFPKELISTHMRLDHSKRLFKCEFCPCSFKTSFNLKRHSTKHNNGRTREFGCDSCGKAFFSKQHLITHMEVHSTALFNCELCGRTYSAKRNLKAHLLKLHPSETQHIL